MLTGKESPKSLDELLGPYARRFEGDRLRLMIEPGTPVTLAEAMLYCTQGGKRLRPSLVYMTAEAVGGADSDLTARAAVAVELIHCYSLVHDDLPSMDDDTLRRGRPTAHVQFGEAMAILTGDALLTRAMGLLGIRGGGALVGQLASAAGGSALIAGQVADMELCEVPDGAQGVQYVHLRKTAALISAAARMGAMCGGGCARDVESAGAFGQALGLAFQIVDDLLDVSSTAEALGKTPGKDAAVGKRTAVALLGVAAARAQVDALVDEAQASLDVFGPRREKLVCLTYLLARRDR